MNREELIEAIKEARNGWHLAAKDVQAGLIADTVLAVFEKAQAPTDDELSQAISNVQGYIDAGGMVGHSAAAYRVDGTLRLLLFDDLAMLLNAVRRPAQTEPTEALEKITEVISALSINLNNEAYGKPDAEWGQIQRQLQGVEFVYAALKAAFTAGQEEQS